MNKLELLEDRKVFEAVFRNGGSIEADVETGEGDETRSRTERFDYSIREYLSTSDASHFFPRTVSNQMLEAAEPLMILSPLLNTVRIATTANTVDYYAVGAIQAHEIPEGMEYPEEQAIWAKAAKTAKVTKKGLKVPITQELLDDNLFDVMGMYIRAAGRAMARYKEELTSARFSAAAVTSLTNVGGAGNYQTTGVGSDGVTNGSLDGHDLLQVFGQMLASGRTPTDVIMHPLAWTMFADDPIVRNLSIWNVVPGPAVRQETPNGTPTDGFYKNFLQKTVPFGINVITSPYVSYTPGTPAKTDVYIIDRNDIGVLTMREDLTTDQFEDPTRDIVAMKVKERYDITVMDTEGYNILKVVDVNILRNYGTDVTFVNTLP